MECCIVSSKSSSTTERKNLAIQLYVFGNKTYYSVADLGNDFIEILHTGIEMGYNVPVSSKRLTSYPVL
jgi:hypothetical protein